MATTTNYGWTTPDDTALVKDGAAAIRTLGSSVDTTTKALNPSTTLGDIEYRSSTANTNTRLGIGSTGQVLTVSGGVPSWATASAGGLTLLSTTTLSGSSTSITGISSSYTNLLVIINEAYTSLDERDIQLRYNSDTATTNYFLGYLQLYDTGVTGSHTASPNYIYLGLCTSSTTAKRKTNAQINIMNYASSGSKFTNANLMTGLNSTSNASFWSYGNYSGSAISSIQLTLSSGTWSGGTVLLYGAK